MNQPEFDYLGPYRVEKTLGRGGMGTVYKGVHAKNNEVVAIKVIAAAVANQSRFRRRFQAEIKTLQRLKHPNIVSLKGVGEEQGLLFYTMEYVDGKSLHEHLRTHKKLPWEDVVEIGIQTAAALKHAHDLGIIHRDLKPANLMLSSDGLVKLTDFGIAKLFGSTDMTAAGSVIGTADFMPPEQAEGKTVTVRSDLYGLGAVMYALLSGQAPFSGKSVPEVLYAVRYTPVPRLEKMGMDLPDELCRLVHEMLEKSPGDRPPTGLVVGNRLKSLQQGLKHLGKQEAPVESDDPKREEQGPRSIGTELTSLDLSDVNDEELRLTNAGQTEAQSAGEFVEASEMLQPESVADDDAEDEEGSMHEQATMLAPAPAAHTPNDKEDTELKPEDELDLADEPEDERRTDGMENYRPSESSLTSGGPSHYTPVESSGETSYTLTEKPEENEVGTDWIQIGSISGIAAMLIACIGFAWYMLLPRGSDEIYAEIMTAADSGDDAQLLTVRDSIEEFIERFPEDNRFSEVQTLEDDLELTRWTRILQRRASRQGGLEELSAIEQGFLDCMQTRSENYSLAMQKLDAFLKVFEGKPELTRDESRLVELGKYASTLRAVRSEDVSQAAKDLVDLISNAEGNLKGSALQEYYKSLLVLYSDKPWAKAQLDRVRAKLE